MSNKTSSFIKWLWVILITGTLCFFAAFILVSFTKMPDTEELENPKYEEASIIYSREKKEIGRWFRFNRQIVNYEDLNPHLVDALVATEDIRFDDHSGVDIRSTVRAVAFLGKKGGASTITQQLSKQFFTKRSRSTVKRIWQKMKEWVIAIEFEKRYTKGEIIAMYLNKFDFIDDSHGIAAAANTYFGKQQEELSVPEAATLIGMLKNPWVYNPVRHPDNMLGRRNVVLSQMRKYKKITEEEYKEYSEQTIDASAYKRSIHHDGVAPYFRSSLSKHVHAILEENNIKKPDGTDYNIYRDGIKVNTTLDYRMQKHAEASVKAHMQNLQKRYFTVWDGLDPWTYDATDEQKQIRKDGLNQLIRDSDRYSRMRTKYLSPILAKIKAEVPSARLRDIDIIRMLKEDSDNGYMVQLNRRKVISKDQIKSYKQIMGGNNFSQLKADWNTLNKATRKAFNTKTNMKIFAYTESGERDATMTPLDSIKYHRKHMQLGSVSIEPGTGYVRTWVGGIGNKYFKYDHTGSNRQVGSTFKPFVYGTAISQGISPCQRVLDQQYSIPANDPNFGLIKSWSPQNSSGKFSGQTVTLLEALKKSLNSVSVKLMKDLGNVEPVREMAEYMGIEKKKIPKFPSIALGTPELNVLELTAAYSTFANNGMYIKPTFIESIEDKDGKVLYRSVPEKRRAINPSNNFAMVEMLKYAASFVHNKLDIEFGGKTGTTNDYVDGWFMGITPELVVGTWVGGEDTWIRFLSLADGQGGVMARPYFIDFMQRIERDPNITFDSSRKFEVPEGELRVTDCAQYDILRKEDQKQAKPKPKKIDAFDENEEEEEFEETEEEEEEG